MGELRHRTAKYDLYPDFLLIGAAKAGTTALYHALRQHSEIYMPATKEPNYFAFENGIPRFVGPGDEALYTPLSTDLDAYRTLFPRDYEEKICGEASHWYLYSQEAPARICRALPSIKLLAILRDPIERAYSTFLHMRLHGREDLPDFDAAIRREPERIAKNWSWGHYLRRGLYFEQLSRYFTLFDPAQIRVYLYEELIRNRADIVCNMFRFLGVSDSFLPPPRPRYNVSGIPRHPAVHRLVAKTLPAYGALRRFVPIRLRDTLRQAYNRDLRRPALSPSIRADLLPYFREDIMRLQDLLEKDLTDWLV